MSEQAAVRSQPLVDLSNIYRFLSKRPNELKRKIAEGLDINKSACIDSDSETTLLVAAIKKDNFELVRALITAKARTDIPDASGNTALHWASGNKSIKILEILPQEKLGWSLRNKVGGCALTDAAKMGSEDVVRILLDKKAEVDALGEGDNTALNLAAYFEHTEVAKILLAAKANVNSKNVEGFFPLLNAVYRNHTEMVSVLLEAKALPDEMDTENMTALHHAVDKGLIGMVELLIRHGADVNKFEQDSQRSSPLDWAVHKKNTKLTKVLLGAKADPNAKSAGTTPLATAVWAQSTELVEMLLKAKAEPNCKVNADEVALLYMAANHGLTKIVQLLIQHRARVDQVGPNESPLVGAVLGGRVEIARILLENKACPEAEDGNGISVLGETANSGHDEMLQLLIQHRANLNKLTGPCDDAPLHRAVGNGHITTAEFLLAAKADVNAKNHTGSTALLLASSSGTVEMVRTLIRARAELESADIDPDTPLMRAIQGKRTKVVQILLEAKACVTPKMTTEMTPAESMFLAEAIRSGVMSSSSKVAKPSSSSSVSSASVKPGAASIDISDASFLKAVKSGELSQIKKMIEAGVNLEASNADQNTALMLAILSDKEKVADYLLESKANPRTFNAKNQHPLYLAASKGYTKLLSRLISLSDSATLNAEDEDGYTVLMRVAKNKIDSCENIQQLLAAKAEPGLKNHRGETALELAKQCKPRPRKKIQYLQRIVGVKAVEALDKSPSPQEPVDPPPLVMAPAVADNKTIEPPVVTSNQPSGKSASSRNTGAFSAGTVAVRPAKPKVATPVPVQKPAERVYSALTQDRDAKGAPSASRSSNARKKPATTSETYVPKQVKAKQVPQVVSRNQVFPSAAVAKDKPAPAPKSATTASLPDIEHPKPKVIVKSSAGNLDGTLVPHEDARGTPPALSSLKPVEKSTAIASTSSEKSDVKQAPKDVDAENPLISR